MELRQLKYFVTVAKTLSFSEASRKLYITQGTLSQQIKQLEYEFGTPLFSRTSHSVVLTEAGIELLPLAEKTLEDSENCKHKMTDLKSSLSGELNIGVTCSFSALLTGTVKEFLRKHPGVKLNIHYKTASELMEMLKKKEVDFVLAFKPSKNFEEIESETLFDTELSVIMSRNHPLADRKELRLEELKRYGMALPGSGLQARKAFEKFIDLDTSGFDIRVELNDPMILMDIVQSTSLISILSSLAIAYRPSLVAVPIENVRKAMTGCVHTRKGQYHKKSAEVFLGMLRDSAMIEKVCMEV